MELLIFAITEKKMWTAVFYYAQYNIIHGNYEQRIKAFKDLLFLVERAENNQKEFYDLDTRTLTLSATYELIAACYLDYPELSRGSNSSAQQLALKFYKKSVLTENQFNYVGSSLLLGKLYLLGAVGSGGVGSHGMRLPQPKDLAEKIKNTNAALLYLKRALKYTPFEDKKSLSEVYTLLAFTYIKLLTLYNKGPGKIKMKLKDIQMNARKYVQLARELGVPYICENYDKIERKISGDKTVYLENIDDPDDFHQNSWECHLNCVNSPFI